MQIPLEPLQGVSVGFRAHCLRGCGLAPADSIFTVEVRWSLQWDEIKEDPETAPVLVASPRHLTLTTPKSTFPSFTRSLMLRAPSVTFLALSSIHHPKAVTGGPQRGRYVKLMYFLDNQVCLATNWS